MSIMAVHIQTMKCGLNRRLVIILSNKWWYCLFCECRCLSTRENMNSSSHIVPPGFRFHPTDEELVDYYLRKRVASKQIDLDVIKDVDLYRIEPWDLDGNVHKFIYFL